MYLIALASPDGFASLQVGSGTCFYLTTSPADPFSGGGGSATNNGEEMCNTIGLSLAKLENDAEKKAIANLLSK